MQLPVIPCFGSKTATFCDQLDGFSISCSAKLTTCRLPGYHEIRETFSIWHGSCSETQWMNHWRFDYAVPEHCFTSSSNSCPLEYALVSEWCMTNPSNNTQTCRSPSPIEQGRFACVWCCEARSVYDASPGAHFVSSFLSAVAVSEAFLQGWCIENCRGLASSFSSWGFLIVLVTVTAPCPEHYWRWTIYLKMIKGLCSIPHSSDLFLSLIVAWICCRCHEWLTMETWVGSSSPNLGIIFWWTMRSHGSSAAPLGSSLSSSRNRNRGGCRQVDWVWKAGWNWSRACSPLSLTSN